MKKYITDTDILIGQIILIGGSSLLILEGLFILIKGSIEWLIINGLYYKVLVHIILFLNKL